MLKEYEELKEKVEDIYEFEPKKPFIFDDGKHKNIIKDIISSYAEFPSTKVENKETTGSPLKNSVLEFENNLSDFNHLLLENPQPTFEEDGNVRYPEDTTYFPLELEQYGYKEQEYPKSFYLSNMYLNEKNIMLIDELFASEEMYYQACYDIMVELINMVPEEKLPSCFAAIMDLFTFDTVIKACEDGDYTALFDGIINHSIVFVYTDDNGIRYRIESDSWDADYDGEFEDCVHITMTYIFDDETKFQ